MAIKDIVNKKFLRVNSFEKVGYVLDKIDLEKQKSALVFDNNSAANKSYLGVVNLRKIMSFRKSLDKCAVLESVLNYPAIAIGQNHLIYAKKMLDLNSNELVVEEKGEVVGVLSALDLIYDLSKSKSLSKQIGFDVDFKNLNVSAIKLEKPSVVLQKDKVSKVISIMNKEMVDQVLLFDKRELKGVVSMSDLLRYMLDSKRRNDSENLMGKDKGKISAMAVSNFATMDDLLTVGREVSLKKAISMMKLANVRDLIIKEGDKVFGLLTVKSILSYVLNSRKKEGRKVGFSGIRKLSLDAEDERKLRDSCLKDVVKLRQKFGEEIEVSFRFKEMKSSGAKHKYSVRLQVKSAKDNFAVQNVGWKLNNALKDSLKEMVNLMKKKKGR